MTLRVPFEGFVDAVKKHVDSKDVYVFSDEVRTVLTAGCKNSSVVVVCSVKQPKTQVCESLKKAGIECSDGIWSVDDDTELLSLPHVAAISYRANASKTGIWVEVSKERLTEGELILKMMKEFQASGELGEMSLEAFCEVAQVNVQLLSPVQLEELMSQKGG